MATQGGIIEQKTIGINVGHGGTLNNVEIIDDKIQLKAKSFIGGQPIFYDEGQWISNVIDIGDNFSSYGKLFTAHLDNEGSFISIQTRTSNDGVSFDSWSSIEDDGSILSVRRKFIQVRVTFYAGYSLSEPILINSNMNNTYIDTSNGIKLKRNYEFDMDKDNNWEDEGFLYRKLISRNEWLRIDRLEVK